MKILITCGGTGGHIFPAISLAEELKSRGGSDIVFLVDVNVKTEELIGTAGFDFRVLRAPKMPYGLSAAWPLFFMRLIHSFFQAKSIVKAVDPDIAVGFGAYISWPVIMAAKLLGKKILIHEQNVVLGRANSLLLNAADRVCFSFDNKLLGMDKKYILTGNPIRQDLLKGLKTLTRSMAVSYLNLSQRKKTVLVLGGSGGASAINDMFIDLSDILTKEEKESIQVAHITGNDDMEHVSENYRRCRVEHWTMDFYDRMAVLYKAADIIICRAGAMTIAEACLFGLPAIFIPYPGAGSHQVENAQAIVAAGAGIMLDQDNTSADSLKRYIFELLRDEERFIGMRDTMRSLARPYSAPKVADVIEEMGRC